jgi:hypothetical protein
MVVRSTAVVLLKVAVLMICACCCCCCRCTSHRDLARGIPCPACAYVQSNTSAAAAAAAAGAQASVTWHVASPALPAQGPSGQKTNYCAKTSHFQTGKQLWPCSQMRHKKILARVLAKAAAAAVSSRSAVMSTVTCSSCWLEWRSRGSVTSVVQALPTTCRSFGAGEINRILN